MSRSSLEGRDQSAWRVFERSDGKLTANHKHEREGIDRAFDCACHRSTPRPSARLPRSAQRIAATHTSRC